MNTQNHLRLGATEAYLEAVRSLIGRLERLSSVPGATDQSRRKVQQRIFSAWLALSPREQLADLRAYFEQSGWDTGIALSQECYRLLVPSFATGVEQRMFYCCLQVALAGLRNDRHPGRALARQRVFRMLALAREHHGTLAMDGVSQALGCSARQFARLFTQRTGVTFRRYSLWLRMLTSVELLRETAEPVKSIAGRLGYADPSNFVREFHRTFGTTPGDFRGSCGFDDRQGGLGYTS